jgi:hypothetical protein
MKHELRILSPGDTYCGPALKMTTNNYSWGNLRATVGQSIPETIIAPQPSTACKGEGLTMENDGVYYVVDIVGAGATSKVFLALDTNGMACVIKMYVKRTDNNSSLDLKKAAFLKTAKDKTSKEATKLLHMYPFLEGKVSTKTLNNHHCVIMPFFRPLQKDERTDSWIRREIEETLEKFFAEGNTYADCDVHWSHVGIYQHEEKKKVVLFDLADLVSPEMGKTPTKEAFVGRQMKRLEGAG